MHRALAGLLVVTSCACGASRTPGRIVGSVAASVGGTLILAGLTSDTRRDNFGDALRAGIQADMMTATGILTTVFGVGLLLVNELRPPRPEPPIAGQLHQLTVPASFAARAGQCTAVRVIHAGL
jgi:hypothetical protein